MSSAINSVNAELRPHLNWLLRLLSRGSFQPRTVPIVRKLINALGAKPALPGPLVEIHNIVGRSGSPGIKVYVVNRQVQTQVDQRGMPAVLFIHGGGYISGTAAMSVSTAQKMAERLNCVVVLPDYRVAPETRFPESMEDNYSTLAWMNREASTLGIDTSRIAVYGESAGGGHAAALAIAVRDRAEFRLAAQILIYPMLDDRTGSSKQVPWPIGHYVWTAKMNRVGWTCHLGVPAGSDEVPYGAVPARVGNLENLPATFIGVGSVDLFHDEDVEYASRLRKSGVEVRLCLVPGAYHGFDSLAPETECSRYFINAWSDLLIKIFAGERIDWSATTEL